MSTSDRAPVRSRMAWSDDPLWATVYDWSVEHRRLGGVAWRVGINSDLGLLYSAADEIGRLPVGAKVLDVPCGGGVALRGLRPGQGVEYVAADIAEAMLERTRAVARRRGLEGQVRTVAADVAALPFDDAYFDLVVSFTGLHCFPDPPAAIREMVRVLAPGGVLTGSAVLTDTGLRFEPMRRIGRLSGLMGPSISSVDLREQLVTAGMRDVTLRISGAIGYFRAVRG